MSVPFTTDERLALREGAIALYLCLDLFLDSGQQSFWDGPEDVTISSRTYVAIGAYGGVSTVTMGADLGGGGIELVLDASKLLSDANDVTDPAYFLSTIISDGGYRQRRMELAYSIWNAETGAHIRNVRRFTGLIDQMEIREEPGGEEGGRALLIVRCESLALRYGQRIGRVRSHEDQQEIWAGDDFFKYCAGSVAQERQLVWGRGSSTTPAASAGASNIIRGGGRTVLV